MIIQTSLNSHPADSIIAIINRLGDHKLTATSHLYPFMGEIKIIDASKRHTQEFNSIALTKPAIGLIEVVLSANRSYVRHVQHHIIRLSSSDISSFRDLINRIERDGEQQFYSFWGPKDPKKFRVLIDILQAIQNLKTQYPEAQNDYELMNCWASHIDLANYTEDIIGSIRNVAIATVQHLRMTFGVNTVKPDLRVKEVLRNEFNLGFLSDIKAIQAVEQISTISGLSALMLDQIFVNYGSGYYNRVEKGPRKRFSGTSCVIG